MKSPEERVGYARSARKLRTAGAVVVGALLAGATLGCTSSNGDVGATDDGAVDGGLPADGGLPDAAATPDAGARDGSTACAGSFVARIEGRAVDEEGLPVEGARPQACIRIASDGHLICLAPPTASADGSFSIDVPEDSRCVEQLTLRLLLPGSTYATTYCHVPVAPVDGVQTVAEPTVLYATEPPAVLPSEGDADASRAVVFADGLELEVTPSSLGFGVAYDQLAARRVPLDPAPCFAADTADTAGLEGLYALRPEGPVSAGGFPVRIPNATGLAPGTPVELLVLGGLETELADGTPVREADFGPFGTGMVDSSGSHVVSDDGVGLPYLTWLGYRTIP